MNKSARLWLGAVALTAWLPAIAAPVQAASFQDLGQVDDGGFIESIQDLSADGSTMISVGSGPPGFGFMAYRWTETEGWHALGDLPGGAKESLPRTISGDGAVVVGWSSGSVGGINNIYPFRWTQTEGMVALPGGPVGDALIVSRDGSTIFGIDWTAPEDSKFYRWRDDEGLVPLPNNDPPIGGIAASSADGTFLVGYFGADAAIWSEETGTVMIDPLPGYSNGQAIAVSADGSVVAGYCRGAEHSEAFRWTEETGVVGLGGLPGGDFFSKAYGMTGDGSIIVGYTTKMDAPYPYNRKAFIWDATHGMRGLQDLLINQHALGPELEGWSLARATDISDDGRLIVGRGHNPAGDYVGWRAVIPEPSTAVLAAMGCLSLLIFGCRRRRLNRKR